MLQDFNYHDHLYSTDNHPNRTETSGGVLIGDGLNTLSNFGFEGLSRDKWDKCSSIDYADCFTPKGFSAMTMQLEAGVFVDFYNIHADAGYIVAHSSPYITYFRMTSNHATNNLSNPIPTL